MDTIKYLQVFSVIILVLITCLTWLLRPSYKEKYEESESIEQGLGLPLSTLKTITFAPNAYYSEIGEDEIEKLTSSQVSAVFWGHLGKPVYNFKVDDNQLLTQISAQMLNTINKKINENDKPFSIIKDKIMSKYDSTTDEYVISSKHIIYREGKMYGFVIDVQSLWNNPSLELKGFSEVKPTGIIMQDNILMLKNEDQSNYKPQGANSREYGDLYSFIQGEAIMKNKSYEDNVTQKQAYGLFQDRGLSQIGVAADK
jgi:hypothetical protein